MQAGLLLVAYGVLITLVSLAGGLLPTLVSLTHTRMQLLMSFLGGIMMGVAVLHLLPHAVLISGSLDLAAGATLAGLVGMLVLVRCLHFHQHDLPVSEGPSDCCHPHDHDHDHHGHAHEASGLLALPVIPAGSGAPLKLSWVGVFVGLSLHSFLDGVALGAAVAAESHGSTAALAGISTLLAVALHKPLDSAALGSLLAIHGWRGSSALVVNALYALICPVSAAVLFLGLEQSPQGGSQVLGWALGMSAGIFLCIALVDIIPEIQFHSHDRLKLSVAMLAGVAASWLIGLAESGGGQHDQHNHNVPASQHSARHPRSLLPCLSEVLQSPA